MLLLPLFWPHGVVCLLLTLFLLCPLTSDGTVYVMGLLVFGALHRLRISHMHMTCFDQIHHYTLLPKASPANLMFSLNSVYLVLPLCSCVSEHLLEHGQSGTTTLKKTEENGLSLPEKPSMENSLSAKGESLFAMPPHNGLWAGLMGRCYDFSHSCCEFT